MLLANEEATLAFGTHIAARLRAGDIITLSGDLGAGKTVLARGIIEGLGFVEEVPSPSFPIVIPYAPPEVGLPVWHVDLYRLDDAREIEELALEEALDNGALIIEWPERLPGGTWPEALALRLELNEHGTRDLTVHVPKAWKERWPLS